LEKIETLEQNTITQVDLDKLLKSTDDYVEDTRKSILIEEEEKQMVIIEKIDDVKEELDTINQNSQKQFDSILNDLKEIKMWKEQKEKADNPIVMEENKDFHEDDDTMDEDDNETAENDSESDTESEEDRVIYDDREEDDDEMASDSSFIIISSSSSMSDL
jgi:hypothetical protein